MFFLEFNKQRRTKMACKGATFFLPAIGNLEHTEVYVPSFEPAFFAGISKSFSANLTRLSAPWKHMMDFDGHPSRYQSRKTLLNLKKINTKNDLDFSLQCQDFLFIYCYYLIFYLGWCFFFVFLNVLCCIVIIFFSFCVVV